MNEDDSSDSPSNFALLVIRIVKRIKEELREKGNLSLDNENRTKERGKEYSIKKKKNDERKELQIHCEEGSNQPLCTDYHRVDNFNLFILEDSKTGARVYSLEEELNGEEETRIETAILDALSRHSKRDLTVFASPKAERIVGFVRELTTEELEEMGRRGEKKIRKSEKGGAILSPLLIHPIDNKLVQMRSTKDVDITAKNLIEVSNNEEMDRILEEKTHLFILFWSNTDSVSIHSFSLFTNASLLMPSYQVVGYSNGAKVSTLSEMMDSLLYRDWMEM
ncbi:hypothetical protein PRIPAC_91767 [Pristionchus pacificus]|nr:hypothetical protein PRIPAC_91767 [Pristionchus pacificus]|eukprot:PDM70158.1 hypothetical protein PRIPAC_45105 [Pristionchus pacificus]